MCDILGVVTIVLKMSQFTVLKEQRGPTLKLIISVTRASKNHTEMATDVITVNDLADIRGTLQANTSDSLRLRIGMKKNEVAKKLAVTINIMIDEYVKQTSCPDEWIEVVIEPTIPYKHSLYNNSASGYIHSYTAVINITAHAVSSLQSYMNNQLYEDSEFTDFQLHSSGGTVGVHKAILAVHSDTFKEMLRRTWKETEENSINIDGATVQTIQHLKEYMYLGTLPNEGLEPLLIIAARYMMDKLEENCITKLITSLKPENFDGLVEFACQYNLPQLMKALVLRIPDDIVNGIHQLKNDESDKKLENKE